MLFLLAVAGFGAAMPGYEQAVYPVAILGAYGVPKAWAFNLIGFVLPGLLAMGVAIGMRNALSAAGWGARIGSQLVLLAGLAFLAMGLLPLRLDDLHAGVGRFHGVAWMLWCVAGIAGIGLLGMALRGRRRYFATASGLAAAGMLLGAFVLPDLIADGTAQRIGIAAWFAWLAWPAARLATATVRVQGEA
ncbi:DUF998 domain-containing protein [Pseudoxanthomonas kalamensis]|uniref:DUF998 domain-containing protein n=1 Tax=Pseudoxanthomonas kalamensis TaxID=289483 RepID=UPI001FE7FDCD|nr:DUF998 domain-containing protein [Pseudoxanthomonas kalamensis]